MGQEGRGKVNRAVKGSLAFMVVSGYLALSFILSVSQSTNSFQ